MNKLNDILDKSKVPCLGSDHVLYSEQLLKDNINKYVQEVIEEQIKICHRHSYLMGFSENAILSVIPKAKVE